MVTWAIVVGINRYARLTGLGRLKGAVADACEFAEWALDPGGGGVAAERLFFWTYPWPDAPTGALADYLAGPRPEWFNRAGQSSDTAPARRSRAPFAEEIVLTAEHAGNALRDARFAAAVEPEPARILVFLAGHGMRVPVQGESTIQTCFIAGDFRPQAGNMAAGLVPCESFRRSLRNARFDEVMEFLDCCRSENLYQSMQAMPICDLTRDQQDEGWSVGHATKDKGFSFETKHRPIRGAFSKTLLEGLRGWRDPATLALDVAQLEAYVARNIGTHTTEAQEPYFDFLPKAQPLVVVAGAPTGLLPHKLGPTIVLDNLEPGRTLELVRDGPAPVWTGGPYPAGAAPVQLPPLPDGLYGLRVVGEPGREVTFRQPRQEPIHAP